MSKDPFIREKFTREQSFERNFAREYFERFPKDRYRTGGKLAQATVFEHRVHDEAAARADRGHWLMSWPQGGPPEPAARRAKRKKAGKKYRVVK
jgi:hypothetical protein